MTVLVDTDVIIEVLRRRNVAIFEAWCQFRESDIRLACSPVTLAEVWQGARPSEFEMLVEFFGNLNCISIDAITGQTAGDLLRRYAKSHSLEIADALIAATAIRHDAALWTRNRKHYPMPELTFY